MPSASARAQKPSVRAAGPGKLPQRLPEGVAECGVMRVNMRPGHMMSMYYYKDAG